MPAPTTPPEKLALLERAHRAAERIGKHVPIPKMEALAAKIEDPEFRQSAMFQLFLNSL